jgi:MFS transporter, putative metabolite:H+ symporter
LCDRSVRRIEKSKIMTDQFTSGTATASADQIVARIERLPASRWAVRARVIVGSATFFDGFDGLTLAYILPALFPLWHITSPQAGLLFSAGATGQMLGAAFFGRLAERRGRIPVTMLTIAIFSLASLACAFAWNYESLMSLRFIQGLGLGGQVPVAATYIAELSKAPTRGKFVLVYEMLFAIGLFVCALIGAWVVPRFGWQYLFVIGAIPVLIPLFLRHSLFESPRWLVSQGRLSEAAQVVTQIEEAILAEGKTLDEPTVLPIGTRVEKAAFIDLFKGMYLSRTLLAWFTSFIIGFIAHGTTQWLPSLYRTVFHLDLATALRYGLVSSAAAMIGTVYVALLIDKLGRKTWFMINFIGGAAAFTTLYFIGAATATNLLIFASIAVFFNAPNVNMIYLFTPELFPTRLRSTGCGTGGVFLRIGNATAPACVGFILAGAGINGVYLMLAAAATFAAVMMLIFGIETRKRVLEELSP